MLFSRPSSPEVDQSWKGLYKMAGISMMLIGLLYFVGAIFSAIIGPPPSSADIYLNSPR
jgi:hypothetical protein